MLTMDLIVSHARNMVPMDTQGLGLFAVGLLGAYSLLGFMKDVTQGFVKHFLRPRKNLKLRYSVNGKEAWAVVTGGASGIGLAYARELAGCGFKLCIIDKSESKLKDVERELGAVAIKFDFADVGSPEGLQRLYDLLDAKLKNKDIAVLVNNVAEFQAKALVDAPWDYVLRASNVNAHSYNAMLKYCVPDMLQRCDRTGKKAAVLNVGTCAAEPQNPRFQFGIYGASKAYGHIMSSSMEEMYGSKLDVMTVIPRQTNTEMNTANFMFTVEPEVHAKAIIDQLGYETKTYGPFIHCLEANLRWKYSIFGLFDSYVQWCNRSRNLKLISDYKKRA